ncbi:MAG TPA: ABC-2 family transporter protein [Symbiobacteriaceae bacterium]|nr:ABC-2 family transporter protein [Symbiobacteriaceae bacterium]
MSLYFRLLGAGIRCRLQYKFDFLVTTVLYALLAAVDFLTVAAILYKYRSVSGWDVYEVALLSGLASTANGLFRVFGSELVEFERYLVTGEFDSLLIRPWPALATLLSRNFDLGRAGAFVQGLLLVVVGLHGTGAPVWLWIYCLMLPAAGALVIGSIYLAVGTVGFWLTRISDLTIFAVNAPLSAAAYPQEIYPRLLRWLFLSLLPVAAIGYVPLRYAFGKGGSPFALLVPFVAATAGVALTMRFWQWGQRYYQSSGS